MENASQNQEKIGQKVRRFAREIFLPSRENDYSPKILGAGNLFWYGFALLALKIAFFSLILFLPSTNYFSAIVSQNLLALINNARQSQNLPALAFNDRLNSAAQLKAEDMLANGYFEHFSPTGISPWQWFKKAGYVYEYAGENLALDFSDTRVVFDAWMQSPTHRANILNPNFREMGLAVESGQLLDHQATLAVLMFGSPQPAKTVSVSKANQTPAVTPAKTPKAIATPSVKISTPLPSATPRLIPTPAPGSEVLAGNIELGTTLKAETSPEPTEKPGPNLAVSVPVRSTLVLGAFVSKSDELFKSLYLYFTIFLIIALGVNILVKIKIQRWPTIFATSLLIMLSTVLIFI